jgi:hypothetical protein
LVALGTTLGVLAALGLPKGLAVYGFVLGVFVGAAAYGCFSEFALELHENLCCGQRPCAYRSRPCTAPRNADGRGSILFADTSSSSLKISFFFVENIFLGIHLISVCLRCIVGTKSCSFAAGLSFLSPVA